MRVVVAGGAGFVGAALCARLRGEGHSVTVLSRSASGPDFTRWDARSAGEWHRAIDGVDAVVNLAGESVAGGRWTEARKSLLRDSRLRATAALVRAMGSASRPPATFVSASAVGYYGDRGDSELSEDAPPGGDFLARLCVDWEAEALRARDHGVRVVCPRLGIVLGRDGGALAAMLLPFRLGLGGRLGSGRQWLAWIAREDAAALLAFLLTGSVSGPVNATAPNPVRNGEFAKALGRALGRPALLPVPAFALKLALGPDMAATLLGGQRALPRRALGAGFRFARPALAEALKAELG